MSTLEITPDVVKQDGQNRVARTGVQTGTTGAVIIIGLWIARQAGWQGEMPPEVVAALSVLLTTGAGAWMNISKLRGEVSEAPPIHSTAVPIVELEPPAQSGPID